jgi:hypothetical protein
MEDWIICCLGTTSVVFRSDYLKKGGENMTQQYEKKLAKEIMVEIQKFIDFINVDLDTADLGDKMKWTTFCLENLHLTDNLEKNLSEWIVQGKVKICQTALTVLYKKLIRGEQHILSMGDVSMTLAIKITSDDPNQWKMHIIYDTPHDELSMILTFINMLKGVPLNAHKRCVECDKFFINTSKRTKIFCSPRCAMRKANREREK